MDWLTLAVLSVVFFSAANGLARYFSPKIIPIYAFALQVTGAMLIVGVSLLLFRFSSVSKPNQQFSALIISTAILAGATWAIGQLLFLSSLAKNAPLSIVTPLIVGGIGVGGVLIGWFIFRESVSLARVIGVALVLLGSLILTRS